MIDAQTTLILLMSAAYVVTMVTIFAVLWRVLR